MVVEPGDTRPRMCSQHIDHVILDARSVLIGDGASRLLVWRVQVLAQDLVHGEHVHLVLLEHGAHGLVADDLSLVVGILKVVFTDVLPDMFDALRPGQLHAIR